MLKRELGKRIQMLRKSKKITQDKIAEIIGIDPKSVSQIETGNIYPSADTLTSIAKALDVEIYELFVFKQEISQQQMKEKILNSLNDEKKVLYLYQMLKSMND